MSFGIVNTSGYNFKIVAIPDFDSTGNTDVSNIGFTLMLPAGAADAMNIIQRSQDVIGMYKKYQPQHSQEQVQVMVHEMPF